MYHCHDYQVGNQNLGRITEMMDTVIRDMLPAGITARSLQLGISSDVE